MTDIDKARKEAHAVADEAIASTVPWMKRKALEVSNGQLIVALVVYLFALAF